MIICCSYSWGQNLINNNGSYNLNGIWELKEMKYPDCQRYIYINNGKIYEIDYKPSTLSLPKFADIKSDELLLVSDSIIYWINNNNITDESILNNLIVLNKFVVDKNKLDILKRDIVLVQKSYSPILGIGINVWRLQFYDENNLSFFSLLGIEGQPQNGYEYTKINNQQLPSKVLDFVNYCMKK